jgi:hypothetical protein
VVLAGLSYPLSRFWYTRNWRRLSENELFEQKMLRCVTLLWEALPSGKGVIRVIKDLELAVSCSICECLILRSGTSK